ncbi:MAG TPA: alanyl-tRNA editing protein [Stellaceae bacterium]|nr:alanyl-tRNA editing protein [Stellaceae bacterium]
MTRKVFWEDPYRATLDTRVATVAGADVTLEATIFFALSGGQESDRGTIGGHEVLAARKQGSEIVYTLAEGHGLIPGQSVRVAIDWERRYRLMRLHFAAEIVLELAYARLGTGTKIGAHIAADKARIDFQSAEPVTPLLPSLRESAMAVVAADAGILSAYSDAASERRYWEIPGFARVPCGGTHLRRAREIGAIELKRKNIGKGKERIEIFVDDRPAPPPSEA